MWTRSLVLACLAFWMLSEHGFCQPPTGPKGNRASIGMIESDSEHRTAIPPADSAEGNSPRPLFATRRHGDVSSASFLQPVELATERESELAAVSWLQAPIDLQQFETGIGAAGDPRGFDTRFLGDSRSLGVGVDLYATPEFEGGLLVFGRDVAMKIGGYVKADFIRDYDPIDSTDAFDTTTIPVGAADRTNFRAHARQTRMSFDTRWKTAGQIVRIIVESDFFSEGDNFRLRHAYGEVGSLIVGQTWTTFTDVAAAPATIDFEGSVSSVNRRQAQVRWTAPLIDNFLTFAAALEDTRFLIIVPPDLEGSEARSPSPDFIARLRAEPEWGAFQTAFLYRNGGFQEPEAPVQESPAWGMNFTGVVLLTESNKTYYQILFGEGIGSYRFLPDAAPDGPESEKLLPLFAWMIGFTHEWNEELSSNFTYAANRLDTADFQDDDDVRATTYLAANLLWSPLDRVTFGVEYLFGTRQNVDREQGSATRLQAAFIFDLP